MPYKDPDKRREHHRRYMREYLADPENKRKHVARVRKNEARRRDAARELIAEFKANGCSMCVEDDPCCLEAHHLDGESKDFGIANAVQVGVSLEKLAKELEKCVCLCANCHRKVHAGVLACVGRLLDADSGS